MTLLSVPGTVLRPLPGTGSCNLFRRGAILTPGAALISGPAVIGGAGHFFRMIRYRLRSGRLRSQCRVRFREDQQPRTEQRYNSLLHNTLLSPFFDSCHTGQLLFILIASCTDRKRDVPENFCAHLRILHDLQHRRRFHGRCSLKIAERHRAIAKYTKSPASQCLSAKYSCCVRDRCGP